MIKLLLVASLLAGCAVSSPAPAPAPSVPVEPHIVAVRVVEENWYDMTCFVSVDNVAYGHKVCYPTINLVQAYIAAREAGLDRFVPAPGSMNKE